MLTPYLTPARLWPLLFAGLLFAAGSSAWAQSLNDVSINHLDTQQTAFLPVERAFAADVVNDGDHTTIVWTIAPGYYLYQHQFQLSASDDSGSATALTQRAQFSRGIQKTDDYFGRVEVHYHQASATLANADIAAISPTPQLSIKYQGCAEAGLCYPVQSQTIDLELAAKTTASQSD